ncbi:hypothetical protein G6F59_015313 [Rhizopus arrhizus]|nr:hypothetical protein G6F59_015313 [Rhizopus arrhizus]
MTMFNLGHANIPGTLVAALILKVLGNGLVLMGAPYYVQDIVLGFIMIASVAVSSARTLLASAFALQSLVASAAYAFDVGIVAFQMSSETHARVANAAAEAARAKGWTVTQLNAEGSLPKLAEQLDTLVNKKGDAIVVAMGKPVETDAQLQAAKEKGIPVVGVMSGASPRLLFDVEVNEYATGAQSVLYLLGKMGYQGNILCWTPS